MMKKLQNEAITENDNLKAATPKYLFRLMLETQGRIIYPIKIYKKKKTK